MRQLALIGRRHQHEPRQATQVRDVERAGMGLAVGSHQACRKGHGVLLGNPDVKEICYATQNRQAAVRTLTSIVDLVLVVGAQNSSNSNRLCEVSNASGVPSYLIEDSSAFDPAWLHGKKSAGITAGASTPEELVQDLIAKLREYVDVELSTMDGIVENVRFSLFPKLIQAAGVQ